ncbi:Proprotein convertase subtilisin/kexin type 7 [Nymphon striatum]|nr:Proprotein convertase subtilisin/kexin type 7 [Nymphon striatum]
MPDNRAKNQVDYILVNRHTNLTNVEVLNRVTGSDHRMVRATICINVKSDRTKLIMTRHIPVVATQDQIDQYRLELTNSLQVFAVVDEDIDQANSQLIKTMKDAAKKANPTCNQSLNKFSATTLSLMNRRNDLIIRNSEDLLEKRDLNKTIHKRQRTETRAYNQRIVETTIKEGKGYKTAKKRLAIGNRQIASLKNADGEIVTDREEILRIGERFYQTLYTSSLNIHPTYSFSEDEEDPIPDITRIEVESAIKTLKSGKSAGEDGISSTLIKKGGSLMAIQLAQLFTNSQAGHGTRCAGEIVAAPNNFCGVGISYGAQISESIRTQSATYSDLKTPNETAPIVFRQRDLMNKLKPKNVVCNTFIGFRSNQKKVICKLKLWTAAILNLCKLTTFPVSKSWRLFICSSEGPNKQVNAKKPSIAICSRSSPNLTGINGSTHDKVKRAGETFVQKLYGASNFESLDKYRHIACKRAIGHCSPSSSFQLASLPPTSAAAKKHSYRTYRTVQEWMGNTLPPIEWGWRSHDGTLAPVETDRPVAPESLLTMVSCIRILDEAVTDSMEATAFSYQTDINDIYSCSWGPVDDGATIEGPMYLTQKAILRGITLGRKGYGVIYVVASGNGRTSGDNCNFDGFSSSPYTITIGALNQYDIAATFSEACASVNAVTYGEGLWNDIVTTDIMRRPDNSYFSKNSGCTLSHKGTSAAAPLASAMIALMLEANPCLSWRDVQYIIMLTATKLEFNSTKWLTNAAGISHSLLYGFGKLNAWHLSNIAKVWKSVPWSTVFISEVIDVQKPIPSKFQPLQSVVYVNRTIVSYYGLSIVENVQVSIILSYPIRGYLQIRLMSPSKTVSVIAEPRFNDKSANGYSGWKFSSLQFWGENPIGNWTLLVTSLGKIESGLLKSWFLIIHGTPMSSKEFLERKSFVENSMNHNFLATGKTAACKKPLESLTSSEEFGIRALRMLFMTSICMFFYATWDIIESAYCKRTEKTLEINQTSTPETIEDEETALLSNVS